MAAAHVIPLNPAFRFVHEPLDCSATAHLGRFVGRQDELEEIVARILLSDGGALLVTGYRGVGKSTFVNRVILEVERRLPALEPVLGRTAFLAVRLNMPRAMTSLELMFHMLRGLYRSLEDRALLPVLDPELREDLRLAFARTSQEIGIKTLAGIESTAGVTIGVPLPQTADSKATVSLGWKRASSSAKEISYLAYDDKAAEYDLIAIARRLTQGYKCAESPWGRLRRRLSGARAARARLKVLFVFDELDKLEAPADPTGSIDAILGNLKTLFTTSGISFLFVAGKDTHDRWLEDVGRGDSIYESVFSYARYLPPMWADADPMCDPFLDAAAFRSVDAGELAAAYTAFKKFLAFNGRGIARRVLRKYNERVRWDSGRPVLTFSRDDVRQFRFFADLYDVLCEAESTLLGELRDDPGTGRLDRQRLGIYYLVDWILLRGVDEFTLADAVAASKRLSRLIAPAEEAAPAMVRRLLDTLIADDYIEVVVTSHPTSPATVLGAAAPVVYRLTRQRLAEMGSITAVVEQEARAVATEGPDRRFGPRYRVVSTLGRGGTGIVYLAEDLQLQRRVAIKALTPELAAQPDVRQRFRREIDILATLHHDNIVRIFDHVDDADGCYFVMQYVEGVRLTDLIAAHGAIGAGDALHIAQDLARALAYVHKTGVRWGDPKPSNIMVTPAGRVVLLDFGVAQLAASSGQGPLVHGTPSYMAPEQLRGEPADERSDIYSVGAVLYQMVTGRVPFEGGVEARLAKIGERPDPPSPASGASQPLNDVMMRCLEPDPERRFASATQLVAALERVAATIAATAPSIPPELLKGPAESTDIEAITVSLQRPILVGKPLRLRHTPASSPRRAAVDAAASSSELLAASSPTAPNPAGVPERPAAPATFPIVILPDGSMRSLDSPRVRIGRDESNDLVIDEPSASRYHAELQRTRDGWVLADLNTRNGTDLNGTAATAPVLLRSGDEIRIGHTVLRYGVGVSGSVRPIVHDRVRLDDVAEAVQRIRELTVSGRMADAGNAILDCAIELARAERGFVLERSGGELIFKAGRSRGGVTLPGGQFDVSRRLIQRAFVGEPQFAVDLLDPGVSRDHDDTVALGIRQVVSVPVQSKQAERVAGVLYLDTREPTDLVSDRLRSALRMLAAELLDVLDRWDTPPDVPRRPDEPGRELPDDHTSVSPTAEYRGTFYAVAARCRQTDRLGGDFYVRISAEGEARLTFAVGDVSGHGAKASPLASFLVGVLSSGAQAEPASIEALVASANERILALERSDQFAAVCCFELTPTGTLQYVNAGAPKPLLVRGREVLTLEGAALPIGLFAEAQFPVERMQLTAGDAIVVFSDGLPEALGPADEEFGIERLHALVRGLAGKPPDEIADGIVHDVVAFSGARLQDDLTVIVARFAPAIDDPDAHFIVR